MEAWPDQFCINVTDLERTVAFYEAIGLTDMVRTPLPDAKIDEVIVANPNKGGRIQLAVWHDRSGPIDMGTPALWKLYIKTNDLDGAFADAIAAGGETVTAPFVTPRWPTKIAFVKDPDGYLVELVEYTDREEIERAFVGQYCINVTDIEATIRFYELMGLEVESRTEIEAASEAIIVNPNGKGGKIQLAEQKRASGAIDMGTSFWKLYVYCDDIARLHRTLVDAGYGEIKAPISDPRWPTTMSYVSDPDNYQVELVQRHGS